MSSATEKSKYEMATMLAMCVHICLKPDAWAFFISTAIKVRFSSILKGCDTFLSLNKATSC